MKIIVKSSHNLKNEMKAQIIKIKNVNQLKVKSMNHLLKL